MDLLGRFYQRILIELPIDVFLQNKTTGKISSQYAKGTLVNLSKTGASVIIAKVLLDGSHIFFTAQKHAENNLYLTGFSIDNEVNDVAATTVWMDGCTYNQRPSFKIGIKFLTKQEKLYSTLKTQSH